MLKSAEGIKPEKGESLTASDSRLCSLGTACDMFFVEFAGTDIKCSYLPHVSLKQFNLMDFVIYTGSKDSYMYVLQCAQGRGFNTLILSISFSEGFEKSFVDNTDPFTHYTGDWSGIS